MKIGDSIPEFPLKIQDANVFHSLEVIDSTPVVFNKEGKLTFKFKSMGIDTHIEEALKHI